MRRLFWCGAALIVALTAAVYAAADYARKDPGSCLARCAFSAYRACVDYNPITRAITGRLPGAPQGRAIAAWKGSITRAAQALAPHAHDHQEPCRGLVIRPDRPRQQPEGLTSIDAGTPDATLPAGAVEESEDNSATMPLSRDDDADAPSVMPRLDDGSDDSAQLFNFWMALFRQAGAQSDKDQQPSTCVPAGSCEESESGYRAGPADCREDPAYPYQYPGCPRTAVCPGGRCRKPAAKPQLAPKVMGDLDEQGALPDLLSPQRQPLDAEPQGDSAEETPAHPDVDTMEFRHSDAHEGEFDSRPM